MHISKPVLFRNVCTTLILVFFLRNVFLDLDYEGTPDDAAPHVRSLQSAPHNGFELINNENLEEYDAKGVTYEHKKTGAEIYIVNWSGGDSNSGKVYDTCKEKVFGIFFRTPPNDSTGIPHVLEHSVLCGSRKYKTKYPFANLLQGSLNTFVKSLTFPDRTGYGFASCNSKDFLNGMNLYLDAVFFPRATEDPFILGQEGWHLEPVSHETKLNEMKIENDTIELDGSVSGSKVNMKYEGEVYNQMNAAYSNVDELMSKLIQTAMFPDNAYHFDSYGNPVEIPKLTFGDFVDFHRKYYHPTNSKIFIAVPDDRHDVEILSVVDSYLSEFEKDKTKKDRSAIEWQKRNFVEPKYETHSYQSTKSDEHHILVAWLLNDKPLSPEVAFSLNILNFLLLGTPSSKLYKTLLESGLGKVVISDGLNDELMQTTFSVGLKGVSEGNVKQVEELILNQLAEISEQGFSDSEIESALNTVEFHLREFQVDDSKGVSFMLSTMSKWIYDEEPSAGTKFENSLDKLKDLLKASYSSIFQALMKMMIVENKHRVTIHMAPDSEYEKEKKETERKTIQGVMSSLNEDETESLMKFSKELQKREVAEDSLESTGTIPSISVDEIEPISLRPPTGMTNNAFNSGITLIRNELEHASGIVYADVAVDVSRVPFPIAMEYLPVFETLLPLIGTKDLTSDELSQDISMHTGGISVSTFISQVNKKGKRAPDNTVLGDNCIVSKLMIRGKSLSSPDKVNHLFSLINSILTNANFDNQSLAVEILKSRCSGIESRIQSSGTEYAHTRVGARQSIYGVIEEIMNGVSSLYTCRELLIKAEQNWSMVLENLEKLRSIILKESIVRSGMVVNLTGSRGALDNIRDVLKHQMNSFPGQNKGGKMPNYFVSVHPWVAVARKVMKMPHTDEALIVSTEVNYVASGKKIFNVGESVTGSDFVALDVMNENYLWNNVRVLGGADGAHAKLRLSDGYFSLLSYRDPNIKETLEVYDGAADHILKLAKTLKKNPKGLEKYIISSIGSLEGRSLSQREIGWVSFTNWLTGVKTTAKDKMRKEMLNTKPEDLERFAKRMKSRKTEYAVAVVTSKTSFDEAVKNGMDLTFVNVAGET